MGRKANSVKMREGDRNREGGRKRERQRERDRERGRKIASMIESERKRESW